MFGVSGDRAMGVAKTVTKLTSVFPGDTVLGRCGPGAHARLDKLWNKANYPARSIIVSEDDTDDDVFFVLSGTARAATFTNNGREIMLFDVSAGECFGFFAALDGEPRSTNVIALTESRIARMSAWQFNKIIDTDRDVMRAIMIYLVGRIRSLSTRMTDVTTLNAEKRLITELLGLAEASGASGDSAIIDPLPTQQEIATVIFSQRESVGRDMSKLKDAGLIERKGRSLLIRSLSGLNARLERD